jgi:hypothetical protein
VAEPVFRNWWLHNLLRNCLAFYWTKRSLPCSRTSYWNPSSASCTDSILCLLQTNPRSPRWFFYFRFSGQHLVNFLHATVHVCCSSYGKTTNHTAITSNRHNWIISL